MPTSPEPSEYLRLTRAVQRQDRVPSLDALVAVDGETIYREVVGDGERGGGAGDSDAQYRIGSITKTFTAALVVKLVDDGALRLDDRIGDHIPGTELGRSTILQLLSHTSGAPREVPGPMWQTHVGPDEAELAEALGRVERLWAPGERWHYSNLGYAILGLIIRRTTGRSAAELIDEQFSRAARPQPDDVDCPAAGGDWHAG